MEKEQTVEIIEKAEIEQDGEKEKMGVDGKQKEMSEDGGQKEMSENEEQKEMSKNGEQKKMSENVEKKEMSEDAEKKQLVEDGEKKVDDAKKVDETEEEKMEVDTEATKTEIIEGDVKPLVLKVESESEDIAHLVIEGIETEGDDDEEYVIMTPEEIRKFLEQKISENVNDPTVNPLLLLQKRSQNLLNEIRDKYDETSKLGKALEVMYRNQERFLRQVNIFPKVPMNSVSVSVDLPLLLDSVPLMSPSKVQDEEAVIRKDLPEAKVLHPSKSRFKYTAPTIPNSSSIPNVPSAISITPAVPSGISITPAVPSAISITPTGPNTSSTTPTIPNTCTITPTAPNTSSTTPAIPKASPASASNLSGAVKSAPNLPTKPVNDIECIDLTDDTPAPPVVGKPVTNQSPLSTLTLVKHPAPLPPKPFSVPNKNLPNVPPKPRLKISSEDRGIVLQWDMPPCYSTVTAYSKLKCFDIFGYQEQKNVIINTLLWKKIGSVKAMTLPMACTLTQFVEGQKYHFAIRAVDIYDRCGSYSDPISIVYLPNKK